MNCDQAYKAVFFGEKSSPRARLKGIRTIPHTYIHTSGVLEHKWRASLKTRLFLLTSNTEATENKVQFLNLAYRVKGFQCHVTTLCNCLN